MRSDPGEVAARLARLISALTELQRVQAERLRALERQIRRLEIRDPERIR